MKAKQRERKARGLTFMTPMDDIPLSEERKSSSAVKSGLATLLRRSLLQVFTFSPSQSNAHKNARKDRKNALKGVAAQARATMLSPKVGNNKKRKHLSRVSPYISAAKTLAEHMGKRVEKVVSECAIAMNELPVKLRAYLDGGEDLRLKVSESKSSLVLCERKNVWCAISGRS